MRPTDLIDIETDEITQPETPEAHPSYQNVNIIRDLTDIGQLLGYQKDIVWNPVIDVSPDHLPEISTMMDTWYSPGMTIWLVEGDDLWGAIHIEDWYEKCVTSDDPYSEIQDTNETIRTYLESQIDDYLCVRDRMYFNDVTDYGQWQCFIMKGEKAGEVGG